MTLPEPRTRGEIVQHGAEVAFQIHAAVWFLVNLFMVGIWAAAGGGYFWPIWTAMPWGFALALQGWLTYGLLRRS
jgi:hypothetical protein